MNRRQRGILVLPRLARLGLRALALAVVAAGAGGCGHKIGDACTSSADCDPTGGTRTCDLSQPGGYCILEGCDARSCPSDSVCGRFFPVPPLLGADATKACDPTVAVGAASGCLADEVCLTDPTNSGGGVCVRVALEKRACVESCGGDGDCRGGYVCRALQGPDSCGTLALTLDPSATSKFCAPAPKPYDAGDVSSACSLRTSP